MATSDTESDTITDNVIRGVLLQWPGRIPAGIVGKLEGAKVDVDQTSGRRSYKDRIGAVRRVRLDNGTLRADLKLNPAHESAAQVAWDAANNPATLGLKVVKGPADTLSVVLVAVNEADGNGGLFESADGGTAAGPLPVEPGESRLLRPADRVAALQDWKRNHR